ncbi:MAG TPA: bacteriochlorophyll 4-vinyl reductase, partial [Rhizobiaceae bacterium]|nr:bacteriochlorophyll 4-vinyl reductase [Rhizobiaceae bacterium]
QAQLCHRVGPNAILQTIEAIDGLHGACMRADILRAAGLPPHGADAEGLVDAALVRRLNRAVGERFSPDAAHALMRRAGELTGDYILANRIPGPAMKALKRLPAPVSVNLLLKAIGRHSWTFAGSATVTIRHGWRRASVEIARNPIAYGPCVWHEAVFARLLSPLAGNRLQVRETQCCGSGSSACRFEILF